MVVFRPTPQTYVPLVGMPGHDISVQIALGFEMSVAVFARYRAFMLGYYFSLVGFMTSVLLSVTFRLDLYRVIV
jgi:hypothetical protein